MRKPTPSHDPSHVLLISGREAVLEKASLLERLAERCEQPGSMHWLRYFLAAPDSKSKLPYLVLVTHSKAEPRSLRVENVRAAVLMFEYRIAGVPTKVFSTDDTSGFRTVVARVEDRQMAAVMAINVLMRRGAQVVLTSRDDAGRTLLDPRLDEKFPLFWARRRRPVERTLLLEPTYEKTLAKMGKSTRFNLGYYRRRLLDKMPCEFVADARGMLNDAELKQVNTSSLNPVDFPHFKLLYSSCCHLPGGFLIGLRGPAGEWLSLIGGWRQGAATVLHWQMNASGYERSSLGTVMRSYFLENEIKRGTRTITFYGGTPHSARHAFVREEATDLIVVRRTWQASLLRLLARPFASTQWLTGNSNFLARALCTDGLTWNALPPEPAPSLEASTLRETGIRQESSAARMPAGLK